MKHSREIIGSTSRSVYSLANVLTTHFIQTSQIEDVVEAIAMYIEALRLRSASHPN